MAFEDDLGWEYFDIDPTNSPRMKEHDDWHKLPENRNRTGNYGERPVLGTGPVGDRPSLRHPGVQPLDDRLNILGTRVPAGWGAVGHLAEAVNTLPIPQGLN